MSSKDYKPDEKDLIRRGVKRPSPVGTSLFVGLRILDAFVQHAILVRGLGSGLIYGLGGETVPYGSPAFGIFAPLGMSPYRLTLLLMSIGSALKQSFWAIYTAEEELPASSAVAVSIFNTVVNSLNSLVFTWSLTSTAHGEGFSDPGFPPITLLVGAVLYTSGILIEATAEVQRRIFKSDPRNKGKVFSRKLFSLARHINYGGYTLWRSGYALASGGWIWGAIIGGFFFVDFTSRSIPTIDAYCQNRVRKNSHTLL
jgi:protein-S-isoprenylcysteine O-methyltransferase Ste14